MKIEIVRATIVDQKRAPVGAVVEVDQSTGVYLINTGKAVAVTDAPKPQNREAELEEKTSKRRGRPPKVKVEA